MDASTSHNRMDLHGLLQRQLYFLLYLQYLHDPTQAFLHFDCSYRVCIYCVPRLRVSLALLWLAVKPLKHEVLKVVRKICWIVTEKGKLPETRETLYFRWARRSFNLVHSSPVSPSSPSDRGNIKLNNLNITQNSSSYVTENTLRHHYKDYPVNAVWTMTSVYCDNHMKY
jgi:hypothetical protein